MSNDMVDAGSPYDTLAVPLVSHVRRAVLIGVTAAALVPAPASARPLPDTPAGRAPQATAEKLELGATVLAGGSVALLVFGTIGMAAAGERRHTATAR
jgi:hypothetical protein